MDTNLKISKKIKLFLYRILLVASLFTMLGTLWMGRVAFDALKQEGKGILTGDIHNLPEFRTYIAQIYTYGMIAHAGAGDSTGQPIGGHDGRTIENAARLLLDEELAKGGTDLLYHIRSYRSNGRYYNIQTGNVTHPLFSELNDQMALPPEYFLCLHWDGPKHSLQFFTQSDFSNTSYPDQYFTYPYRPDQTAISNVDFVIAINPSVPFTSDYLKGLAARAADYRRILYTFFISAGVFLLSLFLNILYFRSIQQTMKQFHRLSSHLVIEAKMALWIALYFLGYYCHLWNWAHAAPLRLSATPYLPLYGLISVIVYLSWADLHHNRAKSYGNSVLVHGYQALRDYIKGRLWYKKAMHLYFLNQFTGIVTLSMGIFLVYLIDSRTLYHARFATADVYNILAYALIILGILILLGGQRLKRFLDDTSKIAHQLSCLQEGKTPEPVSLHKKSLLHHMEADLLDIQNGFETAVDESLRSNRMRVELITNVSHDLKTPLTSIINYSELLCEENLPEPAGDYALALRKKAYRLKGMVQDVFDFSKATTGNLTLEMVPLDLNKLIQQTLADMDEQIQASNLVFKTNICPTPLMIMGDGSKLYRVFQNLFVNAIQYSLEHTRVYIDTREEEGQACVWIKNISRQELTFDPQEITERFVRADSSRTTEGSGLGLSIAKSFAETCGGNFSIELNADLFMVAVRFPLISNELSAKEFAKD